MANIKSAIRRIGIAKRNRARNLSYKNKIKRAVKAALKSKSAEDIRSAIKWLDKAALKNVIHKNTASRRKSHLMKLLSTK